MTQIIEQNSENHVEKSSVPPLSTAAEGDVSASESSGNSRTLPPLSVGDAPPAHLASLADRARGYVEAASSANTRKAYASDSKHFSARCRRSSLPFPRTRDGRPLYHGLRLRQCRWHADARQQGQLRFYNRAAPFLTFLELCPARPNA